MFKTRLIFGILLVALAILFIYLGSTILFAAITFISAVGIYEYNNACNIEHPLHVLSAIYIVILFSAIYVHQDKYILPVIIFTAIGYMVMYVFTYPKFRLEDIAKGFFGCIFVPTFLSYIYLTRGLERGIYIVWLIFLCSWGCDTCAYCVGMLIGRHKMSPILSPKKSIEGAVGGILGSVILTFIFLYIFRSKIYISITGICIISLLSGIGAFISMIGDLTASAIKRNYDIKDYGNIIPGHGGILDRFDSCLITAPIIYYIFTFLKQ